MLSKKKEFQKKNKYTELVLFLAICLRDSSLF